MEMYLVPSGEIATEPLDVGPTSKMSVVDLVARAQGAPYSAGICEIFPGDPVDFEYDHDAGVCYMIEGEVTLTEGSETRPFKPGDVVYLPQKAGLVVSYSAERCC